MQFTIKDYRDAYGDRIKGYTDLEIADAVRTQHFPDMDPQEFYTAFGLNAGRGAVGRGLARGIEGLKGSFVEGVPALVRSAMGDEEGARRNLEQFRARMAETQARNPSRVPSLKDIPGEGISDTVGRVLSFAGEAFGEAFPSLALVLGSAVTGGAAGAAAGIGARAGQIAGATAAGLAPNTAESFVNLAQDGEQRPGAAAITGIIKTALDTIPAVMALRRTGGAVGEKAVEEAAARIAQRWGVRTAKGAGLEGLTEGAQQAIDQTAEMLVGLSDSPDFLEIADAAAKGFFGAAPLTGAMEAYGGSQDRRLVREDEERQRAARAEAQRVAEETAAAQATQAQAQAAAVQDAQTAELAGDFGPAYSPVPAAITELQQTRDAEAAGLLAEQLDLRGLRAEDDPRSLIESGPLAEAAAPVLDDSGDTLLGRFRRTALPAIQDPLAEPLAREQLAPEYETARATGEPAGSPGAVGAGQFQIPPVQRPVEAAGPTAIDTTTEDAAFAQRMGRRRFTNARESLVETENAGVNLAAQVFNEAAQSVAQTAPAVAPTVQALVESAGQVVENQIVSTKIDQAVEQAQQSEAAAAQESAQTPPDAQVAAQQEIQRRLALKAKNAWTTAAKLQGKPVTPRAVAGDTIFFESGGQLYSVTAGGVTTKRASVPKQATPIEPTQAVAEAQQAPPEAPQAPQPEVPQVSAPRRGIAKTVEGQASAVDQDPGVVQARNRTASAQMALNQLNLEYDAASDALKTLGGKARQSKLDQLKDIGRRRKLAERDLQQALDAENEAQTRAEGVLEKEIAPPKQAEAPTPVEEAEAAAPTPEAAAEVRSAFDLLIDRIFFLPERFAKDEALNAGFTQDEIGIPEADGLYSRQKLLDKAGYKAPADASAQGLPRVRQSAALDVLELARRIDPDVKIIYKPTPVGRRGQASDNWAQISPEFSREIQVYTTIHEVGGHALGHLGKLKPDEVAYIKSKLGEKRMQALVMQAARDGHPTLSGDRATLLTAMKDGGPLESFALGVEAAAWYLNRGLPVPNSPSWFGRVVARIKAFFDSVVGRSDQPGWAASVKNAGFDDVALFKQILDGTIGKRKAGTYPPIGSVNSPFAANLGHPTDHLMWLAGAAQSTEAALQRALMLGQTELAGQLGARLAQIKDEAAATAKKNVPPVPAVALDKFDDPDVQRNLEKTRLGVAATPQRLNWLMNMVASPAFVAQMRAPFRSFWQIVQNRWIPFSHQIENMIKDRVDVLMRDTAIDKEHKEVVRLMEATNSARANPVINETKTDVTVTFKVPEYADAKLTTAGLRHELKLSKPGDTITLRGKAAELYVSLRRAMEDLRDSEISSLLKRAGIKTEIVGTTPETFEATLEQAKAEILASGAEPKQADQQLGALAKARELFLDKIDGYMPMVRSGQWTVRLTYPNPKTAAQRPQVFMTNGERDAIQLREELRKKHPGAVVEYMATQMMTPEGLKAGTEEAIDAAHMLLDSAIGQKNSRAETDKALQILGNAVRNAKLNLKLSGMAARQTRRRDIGGHLREDESGAYLRGAVRPYLSQMAQHIAYNSVASDLQAELRNLRTAGMDDLANYGTQNVIDAYLEPEIGVARAKALAFAWTLGLNFSSALINLTQLGVMTLPTLGAQHGMTKAAREMTRAAADVAKIASTRTLVSWFSDPLFKSQEEVPPGFAADEWKAFRQALNTELIGQGLTTETSGVFTPEGIRGATGVKFFQRVSNGVQFAGKFFGAMEQFNRAVTFLAAYRLAKTAKQGVVSDALSRGYGEDLTGAWAGDRAGFYAKAMVDQTQGQFNKANRPSWQRGIMGVPTQFMQFPAFMIESVMRTMMKDPEGRRYIATPEGQKFVGTMFGVLFTLGGVMAGVPMGESLDKLLKLLDGALKPFGISTGGFEKPMRDAVKFLMEAAGFDEQSQSNVADIVARGPLRAFTGVDISRRVQIDLPIIDMVTATSPADFLGPAGSISIGSLVTAANYLREGQDVMAFLQLLPVALRNVARADILAGGIASELGYAPRGGGDVISQAGVPLLGGENRATFGEIALVGAGFSPTRFTRTREQAERERSADEQGKDARERFNNTMADYLWFAQRAAEAGREREAAEYQRTFQLALASQIEKDRQETNPRARMVTDAQTFRNALLTRLEQRRSGVLGPQGVVKGRERQALAEREAGPMPR